MREIVFRGKNDNGKWVYGVPVPVEENTYETGKIELVSCVNYDELDYWIADYSACEVDPATIGQFTGLKDKNGKRIFEGDIIRTDFDSAIGVIAFGDYASPFNSDEHTHNIGFYPVWEEKFIKRLRKDLGFYCIATGDIEVVGNIHDNPELLEENVRNSFFYGQASQVEEMEDEDD